MDPATQSLVIIIVAIGGQLCAIVAAIFAGWNSLAAKRIATEAKAETVAQTLKLDSVAKDTAVVLGHVNSEKSAAEGRLATVKRENELLREMIADKIHTAGLLAQAVVQRQRELSPLPTTVPSIIPPVEP